MRRLRISDGVVGAGCRRMARPEASGDWRRYMSNYFGAIRMVDDQIARLVAELDARGIRQRTLIVFSMADHGDFMMQYGLGRKGGAVGRADTYTNGVERCWNSSVAGEHARHGLSMADVMPTLCDAMGLKIPEGVQGRSLWKTLHDDASEERPKSVYASAGLGGLYL